MTVRGKCNTCRARRVKCDETHPVCGGCRRSGRPCTYGPQEPTSNSSVLVKKARMVSSGASFHVLQLSSLDMITRSGKKSPLGPSPSAALSSQESLLVSRWTHMLGCEAGDSSPFDILTRDMKTYPSRAGTSSTLDLAAAYLLDSHHGHRMGSREKALQCQESGARAQEALRSALALVATPGSQVGDDVILAVKFHCAAEMLNWHGSFLYTIHITAFSDLLKMRWSQGCPEEDLEAMIMDPICFGEVGECMMTGRDSSFDVKRDDKEGTYEQLDITLEPDFTLKSAMAFVVRQFVRIPRLMRLVRSSLQGPGDSSTALEAAMLAKSLYEHPAWRKVDSLVADITSKRQPVAKNGYTDSSSPSSNFSSIEEFILAVFHHTCRMLLCGLVQTVCAMPGVGARLHIDHKSAECKDIEAAESIARCLDYSLDTASDSAPALRALLILTPIQVSWGAWNRLLKREQVRSGDVLGGAVTTPLAVRGAEMKEWCMDTANCIQAIWGAGDSTEYGLRIVTEAFAGGPLVPEMLNRIKWSERNSSFPLRTTAERQVD